MFSPLTILFFLIAAATLVVAGGAGVISMFLVPVNSRRGKVADWTFCGAICATAVFGVVAVMVN